jgi:ferredoxin
MIHPMGCDLCDGNPICVKVCGYGAITLESQEKVYKILVNA